MQGNLHAFAERGLVSVRKACFTFGMDILTPAVVEHFGGVEKVAEFFGITRQAVYQWGDGPIPRERALELMVRIPERFGQSSSRAAA